MILPTQRRAVALTIGLALCLIVPPVGAQDIPDPTRISELRGDERALQAKLREARARLDAAVAVYEDARTAFGAASQRLWAAERRVDELDAEVRGARERLGNKAVAMYKGRRVNMLNALLGSRSLDEFVRVLSFGAAVMRDDLSAIDAVEARSEDAAVALEELRAQRQATKEVMWDLEVRQDDVLAEFADIQTLLERTRKAIVAERGSFTFPVLPPYSYTDSFGAPRMVGTAKEHAHEGTDIFAPRGTAVVAVVAGTVGKVSDGGLGGKAVWLRAPSGFSYYYAHLDGFAPDARTGNHVEPGTVLGYVGDTGNARGGAPHLHFEIETPDGRALNPYSTLRAADTGWG